MAKRMTASDIGVLIGAALAIGRFILEARKATAAGVPKERTDARASPAGQEAHPSSGEPPETTEASGMDGPAPNFTWAELDPYGDRTPAQAAALETLALEALQPLRDHVGRPVMITTHGGLHGPSMDARYASEGQAETAPGMYGRQPTSQHRLGKAADIVVAGMTPVDVVITLKHLRRIGKANFGAARAYSSGFVHVDQGPDRSW